MAEKIYTIPVNEAFDENGECPMCSMYRKLEADAISFMMGPSYMEDDIRMETDEKGYCRTHLKMLLQEKNRLGLALILKTHLDRQKKDALKLKAKPVKGAALLKKPEECELSKWAREASKRCYICDRIEVMFPRYVDTTVRYYRKDETFRKKYQNCKGFCQEHFGMLIGCAQQIMKGEELTEFVNLTVDLYTENLQRVADDLDWFADKFDYRFKDEPWKNSKDSIERAATKTNGIL